MFGMMSPWVGRWANLGTRLFDAVRRAGSDCKGAQGSGGSWVGRGCEVTVLGRAAGEHCSLMVKERDGIVN